MSAQSKFEKRRWQLLKFCKDKIAKVPDGQIAPKWIRIVFQILFPLHGFYARQSQLQYEPLRDVYTVRGVEITTYFLEQFLLYSPVSEKFIVLYDNGEYEVMPKGHSLQMVQAYIREKLDWRTKYSVIIYRTLEFSKVTKI